MTVMDSREGDDSWLGVLWQKQCEPRIVWAERTGCCLNMVKRGSVWSPEGGDPGMLCGF